MNEEAQGTGQVSRGSADDQDRITPRRRHFDAFVSAVTSECGKARDIVAAELRKLGFQVAVQSDFEQRPASITLLQKLYEYISGCREVHCIIGARSGAFPSAEEAAPFSNLLPSGITEASYTQWEYFFAVHIAPDRLWLPQAADSWQADVPIPAEPDSAGSQRAFVAHVRRMGHDCPRFASLGDLRAAVLEQHVAGLAAHRAEGGDNVAVDGGDGGAFHLVVARNAVGGLTAGIMFLVSSGVVMVWRDRLGPTLVTLSLFMLGVGAIAFLVIHQRYAAILARRDSARSGEVWTVAGQSRRGRPGGANLFSAVAGGARRGRSFLWRCRDVGSNFVSERIRTAGSSSFMDGGGIRPLFVAGVGVPDRDNLRHLGCVGACGAGGTRPVAGARFGRLAESSHADGLGGSGIRVQSCCQSRWLAYSAVGPCRRRQRYGCEFRWRWRFLLGCHRRWQFYHSCC